MCWELMLPWQPSPSTVCMELLLLMVGSREVMFLLQGGVRCCLSWGPPRGQHKATKGIQTLFRFRQISQSCPKPWKARLFSWINSHMSYVPVSTKINFYNVVQRTNCLVSTSVIWFAKENMSL